MSRLASDMLAMARSGRPTERSDGFNFREGKRFFADQVEIDVNFNPAAAPPAIGAYRTITRKCFVGKKDGTVVSEWLKLSAFMEWYDEHSLEAPKHYLLSWAFGTYGAVAHFGPEEGCWIPPELKRWENIISAYRSAEKIRANTGKASLPPGVNVRQGRFYESRSGVDDKTHLIAYSTPLEAHHAWVLSRTEELRRANKGIFIPRTKAMLEKRIEVLETLVREGKAVMVL